MGPKAVRVQLSGATSGSFTVTRRQPLTLGRAGKARIFDLAASRLHCRIELDGGGLLLVDLSSTNGTFLNRVRVSRAPLHDGDEIRIGTSALTVRLEPEVSGVGLQAPVCAGCGAVIDTEGLGGGSSSGPQYCGMCATRPAGALTPAEQVVAATLVADGFREIERLPLAGHGLLFNARRSTLGQPVTLKVVRTDRTHKSDVDAFLREARITARLSHPNIARVLDVGSAGDLVYTVFERIDGPTLLGEIEAHRRLDARRAQAVALPLARALTYLHGQRILHGDIRPATILVSAEGHTKLFGFSLARPLKGERVPCDQLLAPESVPYAAPETLREQAFLCEGSDLFGFGATLYHALTGAPPRRNGNAVEPPLGEAHPAVPEELARVVMRCLSAEPEARYRDARALLEAIEESVRGMYGFDRGSSGTVGILVNFGPDEVLTDTTRKTLGEGFMQLEGNGSAFFGRFTGSELIELVQLVDLNSKSALLEVRSPSGERGQVAFRRGLAVHARAGDLEGRDAVLALLGLEAGHFRLIVQDPPVETEHELPMSLILLELMRSRDESSRLPVQGVADRTRP